MQRAGMASNQVQHATMVSDETTVAMQPQRGTVATMNNRTPTVMELSRFKNWSGEPSTDSFPTYIRANDTAVFTHLRDGQFGSVGAVQYNSIDVNGTRCAWVLAWQAPADTISTFSPRRNKVYVICGEKFKIDEITFEEILQKLEDSFTTRTFTDPKTKTKIDAVIHEIVPNAATLDADFSLDV